MTVYFIASEDLASVKIGYTKEDPDKRLKALQTGNPDVLILLASVEGETSLERELHSRFRELHVRGEWFRLEGELEAYIDRRRSFTGPLTLHAYLLPRPVDFWAGWSGLAHHEKFFADWRGGVQMAKLIDGLLSFRDGYQSDGGLQDTPVNIKDWPAITAMFGFENAAQEGGDFLIGLKCVDQGRTYVFSPSLFVQRWEYLGPVTIDCRQTTPVQQLRGKA